MFDALPLSVAVLELDGRIVAVNEAWRRFAAENGAEDQVLQVGEGANYFAASADCPQGREFLEAVQRLREQQAEVVSVEYDCHSPTQPRWFLALATRSAQHLIVVHLDITARKLAEEEARQQAHRSRELIGKLQDAKEQLSEKVVDLESLHDVMVNRELHLMELEKEVRTLRDQRHSA